MSKITKSQTPCRRIIRFARLLSLLHVPPPPSAPSAQLYPTLPQFNRNIQIFPRYFDFTRSAPVSPKYSTLPPCTPVYPKHSPFTVRAQVCSALIQIFPPCPNVPNSAPNIPTLPRSTPVCPKYSTKYIPTFAPLSICLFFYPFHLTACLHF